MSDDGPIQAPPASADDDTHVGLPRWVRWVTAVVVLVGIGAMAYLGRGLLTGRELAETPGDPVGEGALEAVLARADAFTPNYEEGLAPFVATVGGELMPYHIMATSVLPGETVPVAIEASQRETPAGVGPDPTAFRAAAGAGMLDRTGPGAWTWTAPDSTGVVPIRIEGPNGGLTVHAFVLVPYAEKTGDALNGYRIGDYPTEPYRGNPVYEQPRGFIEVTEDVLDVAVSPHFTLRQFLCKQASPENGPFPQYLLLDPRLLRKLEGLLSELNAEGIPATGFHVMSGYRTPFYNRSIGNTTTYSAHLYGIAADIFVDRDADQYMDDLNGDGTVDVEDALILYNEVEGADHEAWYEGLEGGLGLYGPAPHRGPFIHVDVRGETVRWGP
jgi:hypothetical protein